MTRRDSNNSCYFFEVLFDEISTRGDFFVGVSRKAENFNSGHYNKAHVFYIWLYNGKLYYCNKYDVKYVPNISAIRGKSTKIGILLDMFNKSLKFFVNDID